MELQRESLMIAFKKAAVMGAIIGAVVGGVSLTDAGTFLQDNLTFATLFALGSIGFSGVRGYIEAEWEIEAQALERPKQVYIYR